MCLTLCLSTILVSSIHRNTSLNPPVQIWGSMKFWVRSLALCCLLRCIWCYPVFLVWNSACSPRTLECMRVWYLATHRGNYTQVVFALADDNEGMVLMTEPQIPVNLKSALAGLALYLVKDGCQNGRQAQSMTNSSLALPTWMLHGHQMAPIQLNSVTMSVKKLLVRHTKSIFGPILRRRDFRMITL